MGRGAGELGKIKKFSRIALRDERKTPTVIVRDDRNGCSFTVTQTLDSLNFWPESSAFGYFTDESSTESAVPVLR